MIHLCCLIFDGILRGSDGCNVALQSHSAMTKCAKYRPVPYLLPHLGWIAAKAPNRVNRAHGPTKENKQNFRILSIFWPTQKIGPEGPKWARGIFFLLIQTLPTFWAERILILRIFIFGIFWAPTLGPPWAQLGPSLGPGLGPGWYTAAAPAAAVYKKTS